ALQEILELRELVGRLLLLLLIARLVPAASVVRERGRRVEERSESDVHLAGDLIQFLEGRRRVVDRVLDGPDLGGVGGERRGVLRSLDGCGVNLVELLDHAVEAGARGTYCHLGPLAEPGGRWRLSLGPAGARAAALGVDLGELRDDVVE